MYTNNLEEKLQEIKEKKRTLKKEIVNSRQMQRRVNNISDSDWWYPSNLHSNLYDDSNKLYVNLAEKQHVYISYKEKNIHFSSVPLFPIIIDETTITCEFSGVTSGNLKATLYLIGYKRSRKEKLYKLSLNKKETIKLDSFEGYRLAIKLEGSGEFQINKIVLGSQTFEGFSNKDNKKRFLYYQSDRKQSITNSVVKQVDLQTDFKNVIETNTKDFIIGPIFSSYVSKIEKGMDFNIPKGRYTYIQFSEGPLYQISEADLTEKVDGTNYYEFGMSANCDESINVDLIVIGYSDTTAVEAKLVPNNVKTLLQFRKETTRVKFLLRVTGRGLLSDVQFGINVIERKALTETQIDLNVKEWFNPNSSICNIQTKNGCLIVSAELNESKATYISYKEKNNSFSKVPKSSTFNVDKDCYYEIKINSNMEGNGTITPILITYSTENKEEIISLKLNELNTIKFKDNIKFCRIAFKMNGSAKITVNQFTISQYSLVKTYGEMNWIDAKEVALLGLVPSKELSNIKMAAIFDEFTTQCFAHECKIITFTPENWREVLESSMPDLLMVESAWRGNNGTWTKKVQYQNEESVSELKKLVNWCREKTIPTVFWNKEDPVHYNEFINTAKLFDFVFTTDSNMVPVYKEDCGHDQVDVLQFAAQPAIHNPITIGEREEALSFAGSYYAKHIERTEDMMKIFDAAIPYGLAIFDRNYEKVKQGLLPNNRFPDYITPYVRGSLKYYEIDKAYKGFKAVININTVKNSPTMFARRVYESLASGSPVLSNYSEGIEKIFGDLVCTASNEEDVKEYLKNLYENDYKYREIVIEGIRRVFSEHTYAYRLEKIINSIQLPFHREKLRILVIGKAHSEDDAKKIYTSFKQQEYPMKELYLLIDDECIGDIFKTDDNSVNVLKESEFYSSYQNILEIEDFDYLSIFSPSYNYYPKYLLDLSISILYAPWEIISLHNREEFSFEQIYEANPVFSIIKKEILGLLSTEELIDSLTESKNLQSLQKRGARILGIPLLNQIQGVDG